MDILTLLTSCRVGMFNGVVLKLMMLSIYVLFVNFSIMTYDIPAYFEDIEPFDEIIFESLIELKNEDKKRYSLVYETHVVPDPHKFTFLQYAIAYFALGIDSLEKVKSAVLIIDDGENGEKMFKDMIKYNGDPDLVLDIEGAAETADNELMEGLQLKFHTWHMGKSSMSFSLYPSDDMAGKLLAKIQLNIME